jgi:DNA-binding NarL/FixJ family response regulator
MEARRTDNRRLSLLIADDHAIFAESLRETLQKSISVLGIVQDGQAMVVETLRLRPHVVVADIGMPVLNGLDAARRIRESLSSVKFVFLTMRDDPNLAAAALEIGQIAFILKHSGISELRTAIEEVVCGRSYLSPKLRAVDWVATRARARQFSKELTPRQREFLQLFAEGASMKEIAKTLNLSEKTVEFHKHHLMEILNLKSNAALVLFALKRGLISIDPEPTPSADAFGDLTAQREPSGISPIVHEIASR